MWGKVLTDKGSKNMWGLGLTLWKRSNGMLSFILRQPGILLVIISEWEHANNHKFCTEFFSAMH